MRRFLLTTLTALLFTMGAAAQTVSPFGEIDRLRNEGKYREALAALDRLKDGKADRSEVLWRVARTKVDQGETVGAGKEQAALYRAALADAEEAVKADARNPQAHLSLAIAAGRVGLISSSKQKIELSRRVKESVDKTLELDPGESVAYHVRGRWNYEVANLNFMERTVVKMVYGGLPNASFEAAAADFNKALQLDDRVINHLELGKTYLKLNDKSRAKAEFQKAVKLPDGDPDDPAHKKEAREYLKKLA